MKAVHDYLIVVARITPKHMAEVKLSYNGEDGVAAECASITDIANVSDETLGKIVRSKVENYEHNYGYLWEKQ